MNTEYINLPDNKSLVKDENGNIKENDTKINDKILILENKIKKVKDEKEKINSNLKEAKNEVSRASFILKFKPFLLATAIVGSFALVGIFYESLFLSGSGAAATVGLGISLLISSIVLNQYEFILKNAKEKVEKLEIELEETNKLEEKYKIELENVKELLNTNEIKETINPISLKEKNEIELPKIEKEIEEKAEKKIQEKQKKLVLK